MEKDIKYDNNWFKKRALKSLVPTAPHIWDYSDSLLLYLSSGVEQYESLQKTDTPYFKLVTKPEREYLQSIAMSVADLLPNKFEYIDLGPGTEHKEQFFFDELKKQGKEFTYIPVDISEYYLRLAEKHAKSQNVQVRPIQAPFEEVAAILGENTTPRFVNIGLTFSNYAPQTILSMLKEIAGKGGFVFINSQMRDRIDMTALQNVYAEDALTLADDKLKLIGLNPDTDVSTREADDKISVWCSILHVSKEIEEKGVVNGDKLLVFQSLRYTKEQLENELEKISPEHHIFDTGTSFIASLIKV
ncbi:MAG: L-histidine N(alpha)-methyltransferase [Patescibacteria group bacterium]